MYELSIALRYTTARKRQTLLSILGIGVGIMVLIVVASMLHGYDSKFIDLLVDVSSDVAVLPREDENVIHLPKILTDKIWEIEHVEAVSPFVLHVGILEYKDNSTSVQVKGVDPKMEMLTLGVSRKIRGGNLTSLDRNGILLGKGIMKNLGAGIGDSVVLVASSKYQVELTVEGIIDTGLQEFDESLSYITLGRAQEAFEFGGTVSGISVKVDDRAVAERVAGDIRKHTGYKAKAWTEIHRSVLNLLKTNDQMTYLIVFFIVIAAAFGISNTITMLVLAKTKEIGMLKAMGATSKSVMLIFIYQGFIYGVLGGALGSIIGYLVSLYLSQHPLYFEGGEIWGISTLPVTILPADFIYANLLAIVVGVVSGIYPAYRAAKMDPVEAIRVA